MPTPLLFLLSSPAQSFPVSPTPLSSQTSLPLSLSSLHTVSSPSLYIVSLPSLHTISSHPPFPYFLLTQLARLLLHLSIITWLLPASVLSLYKAKWAENTQLIASYQSKTQKEWLSHIIKDLIQAHRERDAHWTDYCTPSTQRHAIVWRDVTVWRSIK